MPVVDLIETPFDRPGLADLSTWVRAVLAAPEPAPPLPAAVAEALARPGGPVYVGARSSGKLVAEAWAPAEDRDQGAALAEAVASVAGALGSAAAEISTVELAICHGPRDIPDFHAPKSPARDWLYYNVRRGVNAFELRWEDRVDRIGPFEVIVANKTIKSIFEAHVASRDISPDRWRQVSVRAWETWQLLVPMSDPAPALPRWRGTSLVAPEAVTREGVERLVDLLGEYLFDHVDEEGHLTYLLEPGHGEELDRTNNNMIRQWMATCAMNRYNVYKGKDLERYRIIERNIRHNLRHYYRAEGSLGLIEYDRHINLGSMGLAVQALMEHPNRASFARAERKLLNSVQWCWDRGGGTGQFCTVMRPFNMDHGINFYPGEALLTWSMLYRESRDQKLYDQFMRSFRYYRAWHLRPENRRPAFVPWHIQAYFNMWELTEDRELVDFIFEISDWLLGMQQLRGLHPDVAGRFYDPKRSHLGTPHASSTGVYMEGLIDSYELARRLGDDARRERYRVALVRGIRSCMQLTFKDEHECFYGYEPRRLLGGTRTNVFRNEVRCDNVQHNLMGILKVLERFEPHEYAHPPGPLTTA